MTTLFNCSLNGIPITRMDSCVCVLDLQEDAPQQRTHFLSGPQDGQQLRSTHRESLTVRLRFAVYEPAPIRRRKILRSIYAWALGGGILTTSDRPGLRLQVVCSELPPAGAEDWTEPLTIAFTTTQCPYWEDAEATTYTTSGLLSLNAPGTAGTSPVDAVITNNSAETLTRLSIFCGSAQMVFENIELPVGGVFTLKQSDGPMTAVSNGVSVLANRTPDSADALLVRCGRDCTLSASGSQHLQASFSMRGRYA